MTARGKWTKIDVARLRQALSSSWLHSRLYIDPEVYRADLAKPGRRLAIVAHGIESLRSLGEYRAKKSRESVEHFKAHPEIYRTLNDEVIARFTKLAEEDERGCRMAQALIDRINAEGLPPEVDAFDPTAGAL